MDTLGIEPNTSRMLSERDNQLHHVPVHKLYILKSRSSGIVKQDFVDTLAMESMECLIDFSYSNA